MPNRQNTNAPRRDDQTGFGLGLRTTHYPDYLREKQPLDWLEIITDNFLGDGGKPLTMLERIRQDYPLAMHGVAMSIGGTDPLDLDYLKQVKTLAQRIDPLWVSDHLCWTGHYHHRLHDLYPLPYTDEAARHVIERILQAQEVLGRRLVIENVSSYIDFAASAQTEWEFLTYVAEEADCLLLVDVNNIYVSSVNQGFDAWTYLQGLPAQRVQQIHLAGHTDNGDHLVDTHDHPVCDAVWQLYAQACALYGPVAIMIERDDHIPPLPDLLAELNLARQTRSHAIPAGKPPVVAHAPVVDAPDVDQRPSLHHTQQQLTQYILGLDTADAASLALVAQAPQVSAAQRLEIYHHAYRARMVETLADTFARTERFAGSDSFAVWAAQYAEQSPPQSRSLSRYGETFPAFLQQRFPHNPELFELARLDWDLRSRFDMADTPALHSALAAELPPETWLQTEDTLHPTVLLRTIQTNVVALWQALDADTEVPPAQALDEPLGMLVWRREQQPHFQTVSMAQWTFMNHLAAGESLLGASNAMSESSLLSANVLGSWFQEALAQGWLKQGAVLMTPGV
jgi:uncharacterized protein (UPF0276 family)